MSVGYQFDEKQHAHTYNGKRMYGVTSVLKNWGDPSALVNWAANQAVDYLLEHEMDWDEGNPKWVSFATRCEEARTAHTRKRDKAGDRGTQVHAQLEVLLNKWMNGDSNDEPQKTEDVVLKVLDWMKDNGIKPLKSEMPVYSLSHFYAGIADGVIEKEGKKYILDFKTSGSIQTKAFIQCGAYSVAVKEMKPGAEIAGVVIVHIPKGKSFDPSKNVYFRYDIEELEKGFINILEAYKLDQSLQKICKR